MTPPVNRDGDWEWAQVRYETSNWTTKEIAEAINRPQTQVIARAAKDRWVRNKQSEVVKETAELLLASRLSEQEHTKLRLEAIERVNIEMQARVLSDHRSEISKAKKVAATLWKELADPACEFDLMEKSTILKRLGESMKNFILLERQAHGIVGAIQDPEQEQSSPTDAVAAGMTAVMERFASILSKSQEKTAPQADVVDVETKAVVQRVQ